MFDIKKYDKYTESELACIRLGTAGLLMALKSPYLFRAASIASSVNRFNLHAEPSSGEYVRKGYSRGSRL